jgi:hypothetical protein
VMGCGGKWEGMVPLLLHVSNSSPPKKVYINPISKIQFPQ